MSQRVTTKQEVQILPTDSFCSKFGFCTNACQYRQICNIVRTKFLLHCIVIDENKHTYYPVQYSNELPLIPSDIRIETTIVDNCGSDNCNNTLFYSRIFKDTYIKYAEDGNKIFKIFCSQKCMDEYEKMLVNMKYNCTKAKHGA